MSSYRPLGKDVSEHMCSKPCWCTRTHTWQSGRFRNEEEQPQGPQCFTGSCCPYLLTHIYVYIHNSRPRLLASCNTPPARNMDRSSFDTLGLCPRARGAFLPVCSTELTAMQLEPPRPDTVQPRTTTVKTALQGHTRLIFQMGVLHTGCLEAYMQDCGHQPHTQPYSSDPQSQLQL